MTAPKPEEPNSTMTTTSTVESTTKYTRATPTAVNLSPAVSAFQFRPHTTTSIGGSGSNPGGNHSNHNNHHTNNHLSPHHRPLDRSLSSEGTTVGKSRLDVSTSPSSSLDLKRSHSNHSTGGGVSGGGRPMTRSLSPVSPRVAPQKTVIKDGYVYKDEVVILDKEQKEELLKVGEIALQSEWTFWYDRYVPNLPATEYEANLQVISTVGTVQKFWSIYNNIDGPDQLGFRSNLHFMRKGIKPIWEDPHNEHGGSYNFKIPKAHSPLAWRDLLVLLIGEKIEGWLGDTVCGVSVSSRQQCDNYQVWTAHTHPNDTQLDSKVRSKLTELLRPAEIQSFYYKVHKNHAAFQKPQPHQHQQQHQQQQHHYLQQHHQQQQQHSKWPEDPSSLLKTPLDMRQRITEQSIEKVVADIERLITITKITMQQLQLQPIINNK
ncbi:translation initiation factor eIF 4e-like domain-containing protein [Phascolomyces articulosus]|uniref:Translation initiation factor eIF 4e-like domain-containing protein n=1 Tax=Phascolomyces articulosus TaxID=60185 RepID=A0AAD5JUN1_9FUNG|nr:translation initiation factor eIF 4e-like domain-containing protein [Phascolomyces articulosus]